MNWENTRLARQLEEAVRQEKQALEKYWEEYRRMPPGTLYIKEKKGRTCFYEKTAAGQKSISREQDKILWLARKRYLQNQMRNSEESCAALEAALERISGCPSLQRGMTDRRMDRIFRWEQYTLTPEEARWLHASYRSNPYKPEQLRYKTQNGQLVRSKSERVIANRLQVHRVLYRYEPQMTIEGKAYYPDFMIRRWDGGVLIWEHLGLMDQEDYYQNTCRKLEKYRRAGFVQHTNVLCTYEEDIESEEILDRIIERHILR